jgi:hypothetical protein
MGGGGGVWEGCLCGKILALVFGFNHFGQDISACLRMLRRKISQGTLWALFLSGTLCMCKLGRDDVYGRPRERRKIQKGDRQLMLSNDY